MSYKECERGWGDGGEEEVGEERRGEEGAESEGGNEAGGWPTLPGKKTSLVSRCLTFTHPFRLWDLKIGS